MKKIFGLLLILTGIVLGFYVGVWLFFVGGIIQIIEAIRAEHLITMDVAIGIAKVMFASFCGAISGYIFAIPGYAMLKN